MKKIVDIYPFLKFIFMYLTPLSAWYPSTSFLIYSGVWLKQMPGIAQDKDRLAHIE